MTVKVIATYGIKYETYQIEYLDEQVKEWLNAAGDWAGMPNVKALYETEDAAKMVAQQLSKVTGKIVRVIKEEVNQ